MGKVIAFPTPLQHDNDEEARRGFREAIKGAIEAWEKGELENVTMEVDSDCTTVVAVLKVEDFRITLAFGVTSD